MANQWAKNEHITFCKTEMEAKELAIGFGLGLV
jgi:hypothetical protein